MEMFPMVPAFNRSKRRRQTEKERYISSRIFIWTLHSYKQERNNSYLTSVRVAIWCHTILRTKSNFEIWFDEKMRLQAYNHPDPNQWDSHHQQKPLQMPKLMVPTKICKEWYDHNNLQHLLLYCAVIVKAAKLWAGYEPAWWMSVMKFLDSPNLGSAISYQPSVTPSAISDHQSSSGIGINGTPVTSSYDILRIELRVLSTVLEYFQYASF